MARNGSFGSLLATYRGRQTRSYHWVGDKVGVSKETVSRWEKDINRPGSAEIVLRIAGHLLLNKDQCEELLREAGYPDNLSDYQDSLKEDSSDAAKEVLGFVNKWLHIPARSTNSENPYSNESLDAFLAREVPLFLSRQRQKMDVLNPYAQQKGDASLPYKGLLAYTLEDHERFKGRDTVIQDLYEKLERHWLTILHAESGAGKTSLLQAGLYPRLLGQSRLPLFPRMRAMQDGERTYLNPVQAIKHSIIPRSRGWCAEFAECSLHHLMTELFQHLRKEYREIIIILDQFEEFFILQKEKAAQLRFATELAAFDEMDVPVCFIISLRKDYYSDLGDFQPCIHNIFFNEYRLTTGMNRKQITDIIISPVKDLVTPMCYDDALLDRLIAEFENDGLYLPQVQLICSTLHEKARDTDSSTITLEHYRNLGGATAILGNFLNERLNELKQSEARLAKDLLKELVTSQGTNWPVELAVLHAQMDAEPEDVDDVLSKLENKRLVIKDEEDGQIFYMLAHEYLVETIQGWISELDRKRKFLEETLAHGLSSWDAYNETWSRTTLEFIDTQLAELQEQEVPLTFLNNEMRLHLLRSGLTRNYGIERWVELGGDYGEDVLITSLQSEKWSSRRAAMQGLGTLWKRPEVVKLGDEQANERVKSILSFAVVEKDGHLLKLLCVLLRDPDEDVAREAAKLLRESDVTPIATQLGGLLQDKRHYTRRYAAEILGLVDDDAAAESLLTIVDDKDQDIRNTALQSLSTIWKLPEFSELTDVDSLVREKAVKILGELGDTRPLKPLISMLQDENASVRQAAAGALGKLGVGEAVKYLIAALDNEDEGKGVRQAAAGALGKLGDKEAVEHLISALDNEGKGVRQAAAGALGKLGGKQAIRALMKTLSDKNEHVCRMAASSLAMLDGGEVLEILIGASGAPNEQIRQYVMVALGILGTVRRTAKSLSDSEDTQVRDILRSASQDESEDVRQSAAEALARLGDEYAYEALLNVVIDGSVHVRQSVLVALGQLGHKQAFGVLIDALNDEDERIRLSVVKALGTFGGEQAVMALKRALQDESERVCRSAADTLGAMGSESAIEVLRDALAHEHESIRQIVVMALGKVRDETVTDTLLNVLEDEKVEIRWLALQRLSITWEFSEIANLANSDPLIREQAAKTLGEFGDLRALRPLISTLQDENEGVRRFAAGALGKLGDKDAFDALEHCLTDPSTNVRLNAAGALGKLNDERAVKPLIEMLQDKKGVRQAASKALGTLGGEQAIVALGYMLSDDSENVCRSAARALGEIGNEKAIETLVFALDHENDNVRLTIVDVLGRSGDLHLSDRLVSLLSDENEDIRQKVAEALGKLGNVEVIDRLAGSLDDDCETVRYAVTEALGRLGGPRAIDALTKALNDKSDSVGLLAVRTLGKLGDPKAFEALKGMFEIEHEIVH